MRPFRLFCLTAPLLLTLLSTRVLADPYASAGVTPLRPLAIAHRGCVFECPENTLAAFAWAEAIGADVIELDLRTTKDGHLLALHDSTVDRTTNGSGRLRALSFAETRSLDAGDGQRIPTLDEAFAFAKRHSVTLLLDLKDTQGIEPRAVVETIERHNMASQVVLGVRSLAQLEAFKAIDPTLTAMAFVARTGQIDHYIDGGADIVRLWARWVRRDPALVDAVQARGRSVWVTTGALRGAALEAVITSGAQGLITDHPRDVLRWQPASQVALKR